MADAETKTQVKPLAMLAAVRVRTRAADMNPEQLAVMARWWAIAHNGVDMKGSSRSSKNEVLERADAQLLKLALEGNEGDRVELRGLSKRQRWLMHGRGDEYGFQHESSSMPRQKGRGMERVLVMTKPAGWRWCFAFAEARNAPPPPRKRARHYVDYDDFVDREKSCEECGITLPVEQLVVCLHYWATLCDECAAQEPYDAYKCESADMM